ncbi:MAG: DEAD/DEAH box helicase family protein [Clostridia bacterium]|nr:DEAD/DEAH box helicase family protein [Clostridia bacterium]
MKEVSLFEHNEIAYNKLCDMLQNHKTATIDHATGTGKSFIALKYLYENRDKKFLYLSPTYPIIDQLLNSTYKIGLKPEDINIDTMIYTNLLGKNMKELYEKYDGFIFDEYHRLGAPETKVETEQNVLENNIQEEQLDESIKNYETKIEAQTQVQQVKQNRLEKLQVLESLMKKSKELRKIEHDIDEEIAELERSILRKKDKTREDS